MADYLDAAGSISGDVEKIRKALYGREVRASIAEAIELLVAKKKEVTYNFLRTLTAE